MPYFLRFSSPSFCFSFFSSATPTLVYSTLFTSSNLQ